MNDAGTCPIVDVDLDGLRFSLELQSRSDRYISGDILRDRSWEPFETKIFRALCRPGADVIDIGANLGWYSLIASACVGPTGRVLALEPEPDNFGLLARNLARNEAVNVTALPLALGAARGHMPLYLSEDNQGDHRLFAGEEARRSSTVPVSTLERLMTVGGFAPSLIKSDTQGSEWSILQGLDPRRVDPRSCAWIVEFWPYGLAGMGADAADLLGWFARCEYRFFEVSEGNPRLVRTDPATLSHRVRTDLTPASTHFVNLLLIHPDDSRNAALEQFA